MAGTEKNPEEPELQEMRRSGMQWIGIGVEFCAVIGLCTWAGNWLDNKCETSPGFMIMFFLIGFVGMIYTMIKRAGGLKW